VIARKESHDVIQPRDIVRWLTFTSFWGFISYLLACTSLLAAQRRQPTPLDAQSAAVGMGVHIGSFVVFGSLMSAATAVLSGKSTTEISEERISGGDLEKPGVLRGIASGAAGSTIMLGLAVVSMATAEQITGKPVFAQKNIDWRRAMGTMAIVSGITAFAVNRITGWVARDAKS
jgi:hypothetical protein